VLVSVGVSSALSVIGLRHSRRQGLSTDFRESLQLSHHFGVVAVMKIGNKEELLEIVDRIAGTPILVYGDLLLDRYIWGKVDRISPEAPVPVVEVVRMEDRLGGAGNVVRNLHTIGAKPIVAGLIGDDQEGRSMLDLFEEIGADYSGVLIDGARPTVLKTRVIAHNQQVVRVDREQRDELSSDLSKRLTGTLKSRLEMSRAVVLSDYGKSAVTGDVTELLTDCYAKGVLSLANRPLLVDPHPRNYGRYNRMSVAKPNRKEAEAASGRSIKSIEDAFEAAGALIERWGAEIMLISLGEGGMVVRQAGKSDALHLETAAREVFDVSGAGDTVTAVYIAALAVGAGPINSGVLANLAAGIVVSEVGTAAIKLDKLRDEISRWEF
jgi:rfaE bifunctional protein kinase chain/domain